jgi:hypothetical protein
VCLFLFQTFFFLLRSFVIKVFCFLFLLPVPGTGNFAGVPVPVPVNVGNRYAGKGYPVFASVLYIFILYTLINMVHFPSTTFPNRRKKARTSPCRTLYLFVKHSQIKFVQDDFSIRCVSVIHCFGIGPAWCVDKC